MPRQIREPRFADRFYPASRTELAARIEEAFTHDLGPGRVPEVPDDGPREVLGLISPHAGYPFSGHTAAHAYAALARDGHPDVAVVIGVNHLRANVFSALQTSGAWRTPLGDLAIAEDVADDIASALPDFKTDASVFRAEHSVEVQVPFLQYVYEESLLFVPMMMASHGIEEARRVGEAVAEAIEGRDAVVIASTDMTHEQPASVARKQDNLLIDRIEALDAEGLIRKQESRNISMCGVSPVAATIVATTSLGASEVESLAYSNSGDVMPAATVVGYYAAAIRGQGVSGQG